MESDLTCISNNNGNGETKQRLNKTQEELKNVITQVGVLHSKVDYLREDHKTLVEQVTTIANATVDMQKSDASQASDISWVKKLLFLVLTASITTLGTILAKVIFGIHT